MQTLPHETLLKLFRTRFEYCRSLWELSSQQEAAIQAEDYDLLLELLGQKQQILNAFSRVHAACPNLWEIWDFERDRMSESIRADCQRALQATRDVMRQLKINDDTSTQHLVERRDKLEQEIQTVSAGSNAMKAYAYEELTPTTHLDCNQ